MQSKNDNVGKCGHAKCAGGTGEHCYYKGKPMQPWNPSWGEIFDMDAAGICPSSIDSDTGKPYTEGNTAHRWDDTQNPVECAECGALKD